jgi:hypothetical protein
MLHAPDKSDQFAARAGRAPIGREAGGKSVSISQFLPSLRAVRTEGWYPQVMCTRREGPSGLHFTHLIKNMGGEGEALGMGKHAFEFAAGL